MRINTEFEEDELGFDALKPMDRKTDVNGKFACGRTRKNVYERAIFKFPKVSCNPCVLQFEFETEFGSIFQCADIGLIDEKTLNCAGKCEHEGVCKNGECVCRQGFKGDYCQTPSKEVKSTFPFWTFLFLMLLFILLVGACIVFAYLINLKREDKEGHQND